MPIPLLVSTNGYGIFWNNPSRSRMNNRFVHSLYLSAEVADRIDYYFIYGPEADQIIGRYRELTGEVPLFGRWAYGFWQCKNKYQSQEEIEGVAAKYRALHIPVDNIVQDWFWWVTMGEMKWNPNYPDPQGHDQQAAQRAFSPDGFGVALLQAGKRRLRRVRQEWLVHREDCLRRISSRLGRRSMIRRIRAARKQYWANINTALFQKGVDAWWLDTDEPETEGREDNILVDHKITSRFGRALCEYLSPLSHGRRIRGPAGSVGPEARFYSVALSICWSAALRRDGMVAAMC